LKNVVPGFSAIPKTLPAGSKLLIGVEEGTAGAERAGRISEEMAAIPGLGQGDLDAEVRLFPSASE
jgi:hypothetical protein